MYSCCSDKFFCILKSGINDLGGISPKTIDWVNPDHKWPNLIELKNVIKQTDQNLIPRLPVYPSYINKDWLSPSIYEKVSNVVNENGYPKEHEFTNMIANDTIQDLELFGDSLFTKTMKTIYTRLEFSGPKFWEDTDRGNLNIYYTPFQNQIKSFIKIQDEFKLKTEKIISA